MTRIADTSCLYAFFNEADANFQAARAAMEDPDLVIIPTEILVETMGLIKHRQGRAVARRCLQDLLRLPHVQVEGHSDARRALEIFNAEPALSLPDAFVVHHAERHRAVALTFDEPLQKVIASRTAST